MPSTNDSRTASNSSTGILSQHSLDRVTREALDHRDNGRFKNADESSLRVVTGCGFGEVKEILAISEDALVEKVPGERRPYLAKALWILANSSRHFDVTHTNSDPKLLAERASALNPFLRQNI